MSVLRNQAVMFYFLCVLQSYRGFGTYKLIAAAECVWCRILWWRICACMKTC